MILMVLVIYGVAEQTVHVNGQEQDPQIPALPGTQGVDGHSQDMTGNAVDQGAPRRTVGKTGAGQGLGKCSVIV